MSSFKIKLISNLICLFVKLFSTNAPTHRINKKIAEANYIIGMAFDALASEISCSISGISTHFLEDG
jgi:hypothetical protein